MLRKHTVAFALSGMLALAPLTACGGAQAPSENTQEDQGSNEEAKPDEEMPDEGAGGEAAGWVINDEFSAMLSNEEQDIFDRAMVEYDGEDLTPVTVLATQVVSGANYAFLCEEAGGSGDDNTNWAVAVVYNDLEGASSVTSVNEVALDDIQVGDSETSAEDLAGGWEIGEQQETASLPSEAKEAFEAALEDYTGVELEPVVLLGTMEEDEPTYAVLCKGAAVADNPAQTLYVAQVTEDAAGNAEFADVSALDLLAYV